MWKRSSLASAVVVVCALALCARADAQDTTRVGNEHAARGQKLFAEGRYAEAIDELKAGLITSAQPRFLYALGQAYRMNHQCGEAVKAYREFLRANPSREQAADTEERIRLCGVEDPRSIAPPPPPVEAPASVTPPIAAPIAVEAPVLAPTRPPVYKRWWLWTTVGVVAAGGLAVGLGVGLSRKSFSPTVPSFSNR